jgi:signal transduction histidine kinase
MPFTRFDKKESVVGAGLGMALAYRLASILGAEIRISSEIGQGTSVTVELPGPSAD